MGYPFGDSVQSFLLTLLVMRLGWCLLEESKATVLRKHLSGDVFWRADTRKILKTSAKKKFK